MVAGRFVRPAEYGITRYGSYRRRYGGNRLGSEVGVSDVNAHVRNSIWRPQHGFPNVWRREIEEFFTLEYDLLEKVRVFSSHQ